MHAAAPKGTAEWLQRAGGVAIMGRATHGGAQTRLQATSDGLLGNTRPLLCERHACKRPRSRPSRPPAAPPPPSHNGTDRLPASCSVCLVLRCLYTRHFKKISYNQARTTSSSLLNKHDTTRKDAGPCSSAASVSTCFVTCRAGEYRWHEKGMVHSWPMWAAAAEGD